MVPPVTNEDEPAGAPLEEGVLPEGDVASPGIAGGSGVEDGSVNRIGPPFVAIAAGIAVGAMRS